MMVAVPLSFIMGRISEVKSLEVRTKCNSSTQTKTKPAWPGKGREATAHFTRVICVLVCYTEQKSTSKMPNF